VNVITYQIYLEQPLLATQLAGDPNSSVSFDFIPGSLIRGLLIHRHLKQQGIDERTSDILLDNGKPSACANLFFSDAVRFLHAYPLADQNTRTLPTPRSLLHYKGDEADAKNTIDVFNASHKDWNVSSRNEIEQRRKDEPLKPITTPFCWGNEQGLTLYKLQPNRIAVHMFRKRMVGRATRDEGTVFRYESLAAGQWFGGVILTEHNDEAASLKKLLELRSTAWIGRSRSASYGKVQMHHVQRHSTWREHGGAPITDIAAGERLTLTLLSDTLLRDQHGQPLVRLTNERLSDYLGFAVTIDEEHTFTATTQLGAFNSAWKLPLPQTTALTAGSVIVCTTQEAVAAATLSKLEQQGLGERRNEGYGRIAVNWHVALKNTVNLGTLQFGQMQLEHTGDIPPNITSSAGKALAQRIANSMLQQHINDQITSFVHEHIRENHLKLWPPNSQLGRVRVLVRRAQVSQNLADVQLGLKSFKDAGKSHFQRMPFRGGTLWDWLQRLTNHPEQVWNELSLSQENPLFQTFTGKRDAASATKTTLELIEAVLRQPARLRRAAEVDNG
jgi:CRISPR-associated protein Csx10